MPPILVSLTAYGAAEVGRHGQPWFARLACEAGADAVEVRGELLRDPHAELPLLAPFTSVYSEPVGLWTAEGELDTGALEHALRCAALLGAPQIKMSIGGYRRASRASLAELKQILAGAKLELLVENDQTAGGGSVPALQEFFQAADGAGLELGMTFDMGNWHWVGECPLRAAEALAPRVRYVHCKGVQRQPAKWAAVPMTQSEAPWRTVLRALPATVPHAIEYPLAGDDLLAATRDEIAQLRILRAPVHP